MVKTSIIGLVIFTVIFMLAEYFTRGYFAWGAEIVIAPLWLIITYELWTEEHYD